MNAAGSLAQDLTLFPISLQLDSLTSHGPRENGLNYATGMCVREGRGEENCTPSTVLSFLEGRRPCA